MGLTLIYCSFFESTYKKPSFIKVAIFSDVILVSSYPSCNRKTINLIPHYMIRDRSYLEKLQIIQNINNLMFQVIFIFSDWSLINQIIAFATPFCCWWKHFFKIFYLEIWVGRGAWVKMPRFNVFSRNVTNIYFKIFSTRSRIHKFEKIQQTFWRDIKP